MIAVKLCKVFSFHKYQKFTVQSESKRKRMQMQLEMEQDAKALRVILVLPTPALNNHETGLKIMNLGAFCLLTNCTSLQPKYSCSCHLLNSQERQRQPEGNNIQLPLANQPLTPTCIEQVICEYNKSSSQLMIYLDYPHTSKAQSSHTRRFTSIWDQRQTS